MLRLKLKNDKNSLEVIDIMNEVNKKSLTKRMMMKMTTKIEF